MNISPLFFYFFAALSVVCALIVVFHKNAITSAFNLIFVFFSFAAIYAMMGAHLIAGLQVLVYAGAIMVLFIFVIMLLAADGPSLDLRRSLVGFRFLGGAICLALIALFVWAIRKQVVPAPTAAFSPEAIEASGGNTQVISEVLFSDYILPFELTSLLLLSAIVGTVAIAMRKKKAGVPHAN